MVLRVGQLPPEEVPNYLSIALPHSRNWTARRLLFTPYAVNDRLLHLAEVLRDTERANRGPADEMRTRIHLPSFFSLTPGPRIRAID